MSGGTCVQKFYSNNIKKMYEIYKIYDSLSVDSIFLNIEELYDVKIYLCTGKAFSIGTKKVINLDYVFSIFDSYTKWLFLANCIGLKHMQEKKISPLNFIPRTSSFER